MPAFLSRKANLLPEEATLDWGINHIRDDWFSLEHRVALVTFGAGFPIYDAWQQQPLVVSKRQDNGDLASCAIVLEYDNAVNHESFGAKLVQGWRFFKSFCKLLSTDKVPKLYADKQHKQERSHFEKKFKVIGNDLKKNHKQYGPEGLHWYVMMVGTNPECNGQGYGRELMEKISDLADEAGVVCYLECGAANVGFYQKMGYSVVEKLSIEDPVDSSTAPLAFFLMTRKPLPPSRPELD
jgi:ribosomal protein S18 acetylase RimI-like enzyme